MADHITDDAFAGHVQQHGLATATQIQFALKFQGKCTRKGEKVSLADALVRLGIITLAQRDTAEQRIFNQRKGEITQLLHYRLIKKLGEGSMGVVYLAEDTLQDRLVALKVLPRQHASNAEFMKRFQREAEAMRRLNHVNIIRAFSIEEDQNRHFFVMEYFDGESLDKRLRHGPLSHIMATEIIIQVARGLRYAHEAGVIHRDIKPANIIMAEGIAKILDLGLSKNIEGEKLSFLTQSGVGLGTPHYISPEQARGDKDVDGRSDIYSLGATYYHLVTGETPFHGSSAFEVITKHLNEQIPDPRDIREEIPEGVVHVIRKMMAKDREDRYGDCGELLKDLELVADGLNPASPALDAMKLSVAMMRGKETVRRTVAMNDSSVVGGMPTAMEKWPNKAYSKYIPFAVVVGISAGVMVLVGTLAMVIANAWLEYINNTEIEGVLTETDAQWAARERLVGWWKLDDTKGVYAADSTGRFLGKVSGWADWVVEGKINGALRFDGIDDDIRVPREFSLEPAAVTCMAWIQIDERVSQCANVLQKTWRNSAEPVFASYALLLNPDGEVPTALAFITGFSGKHDILTSPKGLIAPGKWVHVVGVYDPEGAPPSKRIFVNGKQVAESNPRYLLEYDTTIAGDLYIGQNGRAKERFKGLIDDVRIYSRALPTAKIKAIAAGR